MERGPTRERGRLARTHSRYVTLSFLRCGTRPPSARPGSSKSDGKRTHPGARASRPHALPLRAALLPCNAAPGKPARHPGAARVMGGESTRERGRLARIHCRCVPLSFLRCGTRHAGTPPRAARVIGGGATRERGRPARMHCRCGPLSFPAMRHPAILSAGTAWAGPKQSPGAVDTGRPGWSRLPRLCQDLCGRDARAPGWASGRPSRNLTHGLRPPGQMRNLFNTAIP